MDLAGSVLSLDVVAKLDLWRQESFASLYHPGSWKMKDVKMSAPKLGGFGGWHSWSQTVDGKPFSQAYNWSSNNKNKKAAKK